MQKNWCKFKRETLYAHSISQKTVDKPAESTLLPNSMIRLRRISGGTTIPPLASTFILDQKIILTCYWHATCLFAHIPVILEAFFRASPSISSSSRQNASTSDAASLNVNLNSFHWYSRDPSPFTEPRTLASTSNPFLSTERIKASFKKT